MEFPNARIIVFAKAPEVGKVKTRLIPALGEERAARLHCAMVEHTLQTVTKIKLCPVSLWCSPNPLHVFFQDFAQRYSVPLKQQTGDDLGERMYHAFTDELQSAKKVIIIGTDCPDLQSCTIYDALLQLQNNSAAVIAPAFDGGYVLLGLTHVKEQLFSEIDWGSEKVFGQTIERMKSLHYNYAILNTFHDIDRPEDLVYLNKSQFIL